MARPHRDEIDTFINITGASEAVALQRLEEHGGDLSTALNAHFNGGDGSNDFMAIVPGARRFNPFDLLDPNFHQSIFDWMGAADFSSCPPWVSHPREVREIPIEFMDGNMDDLVQVEPRRRTLPLFSAAESFDPFNLLDPSFRNRLFDWMRAADFDRMGASGFSSDTPWVSHPRDVREIPIESRDENDQSV